MDVERGVNGASATKFEMYPNAYKGYVCLHETFDSEKCLHAHRVVLYNIILSFIEKCVTIIKYRLKVSQKAFENGSYFSNVFRWLSETHFKLYMCTYMKNLYMFNIDE